MMSTQGWWRAGRTVAALVIALIAVVGCGGGAADQAPLPKTEVTGTAYDPLGNALPSVGARARGAQGVGRTANPLQGTTLYNVSVSGLAAPYLIESAYYTLAFDLGSLDTSPLTNLVIGALFGRNDAGLYDAYSPGSDVVARVTDANLAAAQERATAFLRDTLGLTVPVGIDLLGPIDPVGGNALWQLLHAYGQRRSALGEEAYLALEAQMVADAQACIVESIDITTSAGRFSFCPTLKSATSNADDPTRVDNVFTDRPGNELKVSLAGDAVTSATYADTGGHAYACSGAGCAGISAGTPLGDGSRPLVFAAAALKGPAGTATLAGTLTAPVPGVVLPTLPCTVNGFHVVLPDRHVISDCADVAPPVNDIGIAGTYGLTQGTTRRLLYAYTNTMGSNGLAPAEVPALLSVEIEGSTLVRVTLTRTDPGTGALTLDFKCRGADCNGVSVSAPAVNTDFGIEIELRDLTFTGTRLAQVGTDGALSPTEAASLSGTFKAIDIVSTLDNGFLSPPPDCSGAAERILFTLTGETVPYGYCADYGFVPPSTVPNDQGGITFTLQTGNTTSDNVVVVTDASGSVVRAEMNAVSYNQRFVCTGDCTGIFVGTPDGGGSRSITFSSATLRQLEPDGFPGGDRTAVGSGSVTAPPP